MIEFPSSIRQVNYHSPKPRILLHFFSTSEHLNILLYLATSFLASGQKYIDYQVCLNSFESPPAKSEQ